MVCVCEVKTQDSRIEELENKNGKRILLACFLDPAQFVALHCCAALNNAHSLAPLSFHFLPSCLMDNNQGYLVTDQPRFPQPSLKRQPAGTPIPDSHPEPSQISCYIINMIHPTLLVNRRNEALL